MSRETVYVAGRRYGVAGVSVVEFGVVKRSPKQVVLAQCDLILDCRTRVAPHEVCATPAEAIEALLAKSAATLSDMEARLDAQHRMHAEIEAALTNPPKPVPAR